MFTLSGSVICCNNLAVENATVSVAGRWALTDERGHFELTYVPPGNHLFTVQHRNFETHRSRYFVTRDDPNIQIALKRSSEMVSLPE